MPAGENGGQDLLDDVVLANDHFLQLFLQQAAMLAEFLEDVAEAARFGRRRRRRHGAGSGCCHRYSFLNGAGEHGAAREQATPGSKLVARCSYSSIVAYFEACNRSLAGSES